MNERVSPFGDLGDFAAGPVRQKPSIDERVIIEQIAKEHNFPSRQPLKPLASEAPFSTPVRSQRRYTTGRNKQINIKATDQTIARMYRIADELGVPLGEVLSRALDALEQRKISSP